MIKRVSVAVIIFFFALLSPYAAQAADGIKVISNSVVGEFPAGLTFVMRAQSDSNITDVRLHYRVDHLDFTDVTSEAYIEINPSPAVQAQWDWDMRKTGGLPPGANVEYWWTLEDASGNKVQTELIKFSFDDSRYDWQSMETGKVMLYWYEGDEAFAKKLIDAIQETEDRLSTYTGAQLEIPARIYIYANTRDLQGSMIFPQEWTGGVSFTGYGIIAIGIAPDNIEWGSRAIAHELTHLVIDQMTFNPYNGLPIWLNEGLAMYSEGELQAGYASILNQAAAQESLISVRSLSSPFSAFGDISSLSYAESYSVVKYLIDTYGQSSMFKLLNTFKQGSDWDEALNKTYGFDTDGLNVKWQSYVISGAPQPAQPPEEREMNPILVGLLCGVGVGLALLAGLSIEAWTWKRVR